MLQFLPILVLFSPVSAETNREWTPVPRRTAFPYKLDDTPLEISTDSRQGSVVNIEVYHEKGDYSLQLQNIYDSSPTIFLTVNGYYDFIEVFNMTGPVHDWKIAKTNEKLQISCDGLTKSYNFTDMAGAPVDDLVKPVTNIKFMSGKSGDTATTRYKDVAGNWLDLPQVRISNRADLYPLEFKTKNAKTEKQQTHITLYTADDKDETLVEIRWDHDDYQFWIEQCNRCDTDRQEYAETNFTGIPAATEKVWKLELTTYQLNVVCNDVTVYNYKYNDPKYINSDCTGCTAQMNMKFVHFEFNDLNDNAAVEYLAPPDCTALPESWSGVEVESALPVPYNTLVSVKCGSGYNLTGGNTEILCLGGDKFEFDSQPVCLKDCKDDGKDEGDVARETRNKYLGLGLGSGIVIGMILALIIFIVQKTLTGSSNPNDRVGAPDGAKYVVNDESTVIANLGKV